MQGMEPPNFREFKSYLRSELGGFKGVQMGVNGAFQHAKICFHSGAHMRLQQSV